MHAELGIGDVLSRAFSTWFSNFVPFTVLALLISLPMLGMELLPVVTDGTGAQVVGMVGGLMRAIAGMLVTAVVVFAVFRSLKGGHVSLTDSFQKASSKLPTVVGASILGGIAIFIGFLMCIVPGIILHLMWAVLIPVIVVERTGVFDSFSRSKALTDGHKVNIFLIYLVYAVILFFAAIIPMFVGGAALGASGGLDAFASGDVSTTALIGISLLDYGFDAVVMPLQATLGAVIYHDLRRIKEGVDVDELLSVFE